MRTLINIIFLVSLSSIVAFARVPQNSTTKIIIEPEIELPTIKIPLPIEQISQQKIQPKEIETILSPQQSQSKEHLAPQTLEKIKPNYPRLLQF
jgi:hypothetical protein